MKLVDAQPLDLAGGDDPPSGAEFSCELRLDGADTPMVVRSVLTVVLAVGDARQAHVVDQTKMAIGLVMLALVLIMAVEVGRQVGAKGERLGVPAAVLTVGIVEPLCAEIGAQALGAAVEGQVYVGLAESNKATAGRR